MSASNSHGTFVYPNVCTVQQRGGLAERWALAEPLGCELVEMPADFIKNKTEVARTGLPLCSPLTTEAIEQLYESTPDCAAGIQYILHTEPSLTRKLPSGGSAKVHLAWHDDEWVRGFTEMVLTIVDFLGHPPAAVEIHPGSPRNTCDDVLRAVAYILDKFESRAGARPLVLLENRTQQFISDGNDLALLWSTLKKRHEHLEPSFGVVLDVQQLHTVTDDSFLAEFAAVPDECLKGFHIHRKHRPISLGDEIPWLKVFARIRGLKHPFVINPEVHHKLAAVDTIATCRELLRA